MHGTRSSGGCLIIKMLSYQYRDSHHKDKIISWPSYLYNGIPHSCEEHLYIETGPSWLSINVVDTKYSISCIGGANLLCAESCQLDAFIFCIAVIRRKTHVEYTLFLFGVAGPWHQPCSWVGWHQIFKAQKMSGCNMVGPHWPHTQ